MKKLTLEIYDLSRLNVEILSEIMRSFVVIDKQERFLEFVRSPKRYEDFLEEFLNDPRNLESNVVMNPESNQQSPEYVVHNFGKMYANGQARMAKMMEQ